MYKNAEIAVPGPGKGELVFTGADGREERVLIQEFKGPGILQGIHNTERSIRSFAKSCFTYALAEKVDMWFATKDTISKIYDQTFKLLFEDEFKAYAGQFKAAGIEVLLHAHRRRRRAGREGRGRHAVGVQELRRRRDVGHGRVGVRQPRR